MMARLPAMPGGVVYIKWHGWLSGGHAKDPMEMACTGYEAIHGPDGLVSMA